LSEASFRLAGFNLFGEGYPAKQGKASGGLLLPTFLGRARKVGRLPDATGKHH